MNKAKEMLTNIKKKKGFTLVEVIIVLVILAILAAILIPSLTGYIDKANEKTIITKCRNLTVAAQTLASEAYGENKFVSEYGLFTTATKTSEDISNVTVPSGANSSFLAEALKLSEVGKDGTIPTGDTINMTITSDGKVSKCVYTVGNIEVTYDGTSFTSVKKDS